MAPTGQLWIPYCGPAPVPSDWLWRWNWDPALLILLATIMLSLHLRQVARRGAVYAVAALLLVLFVSPLCALTSALFSARVVHHLVLVAVAAPIFAWSGFRTGAFGKPLAVWTSLHAAVFWAWHYPSFYAAALSDDAAYWLMQATLLGSALVFWNAVRHAAAPSAVAALLAMMVQMGLLGALITFAGTPLYAPHFSTTMPWGLSPLEDQQLAGLIMWAPAATLYLAAALFIAWRWLGAESRAAT
jgi:putative membrane protein